MMNDVKKLLFKMLVDNGQQVDYIHQMMIHNNIARLNELYKRWVSPNRLTIRLINTFLKPKLHRDQSRYSDR